MKLFSWQWLAVSSLLCATLAARAQTRPHYGGTLHVTMRAAPSSLDPVDGAQADSFARRSFTALIFETLVMLDESGRPKPALALSWQADHDNQRWQFHLRRGIRFHDGSAFTSEQAASSLQAANPSWSISSDADSVIITCDAPDSDLPAELALSINAIAKRSPDGKLSGTGPFHIVNWQTGKYLSLAAEDNYWGGSPFLDAVEVEFGKSFHDQMIALDLGKADLIEVAPEQSRHIASDTRQSASSEPLELLALLFTRDAQTQDEKLLREALALSVDRASIRNVLLQGVGQPAGSIVPNWMSGYAFTFPTEADLSRARHEREQAKIVPVWTVGYDGSDPMARLLVERIALNAKDAGLKLQPTTAATFDLRLARISLSSVDAWVSLGSVATYLHLPRPVEGSSAEELYAAEQSILATQKIVPLFHLPVSYAAATSVKQWMPRPDGTWNLSDTWMQIEDRSLRNGKP